MSQTLQLRIHSVRCIDETNGQWAERFGNDEIWLGGYSIAANGDTRVIDPFQVGAHFDDGEVVVFEPPRVMWSTGFSTAPGQWQEYGIGLVLIEKDNGGMREAIAEIARLVQARLKEQLASGQPAPMARGLVVSALKWAVSAISPYVAAEVKRRIIAAYNDDIFQPWHATQAVRSPNFSFAGNPSSARQTARFRDHDGVYELVYDWHVPGATTVLR